MSRPTTYNVDPRNPNAKTLFTFYQDASGVLPEDHSSASSDQCQRSEPKSKRGKHSTRRANRPSPS